MPTWITDRLNEHQAMLWWLTALSVFLFVITLIAIPMLIARIPTDYFQKDTKPVSRFAGMHPLLRIVWIVVKNVLGLILILAGLSMLLLPGEGVMTIIIALVLMDIPGKYRFQKWLVTRPRVNRAINWIRRRAGREPLNVGQVMETAAG